MSDPRHNPYNHPEDPAHVARAIRLALQYYRIARERQNPTIEPLSARAEWRGAYEEARALLSQGFTSSNPD